jgi:hypothetical protein
MTRLATLSTWRFRAGLAAAVTLAAGSAAAVRWEEDFPQGSLAKWSCRADLTAARAQLVSGGTARPTCLEINKPDTSGQFTLSQTVPVSAGVYVSISADLQTLQVGPFAEYALTVSQLDGRGNPVATPTVYAFNDGVSVISGYGGTFKTPQTLGEWKITRHCLKTAPGVAAIKLQFGFRKGRQLVRLDHVCVEELGTAEPKPASLPFYSRTLDSAAAFLDLDMLVPGYSYELTARVDRPDTRGFGIQMSWVDRLEQASEKAALLPVSEQGDQLVYRFAVPERAVTVRLDLYHSDLAEIGGFQVAKYRKWKTISLRTIATSPPLDTLFVNYIQKLENDRLLSKPREVFSVSEYDRAILNAALATRKCADAEVKKINGGMVLLIGGQPVPPMLCASIHTVGKFDVYGELGKRGLSVIRVENTRGGPGMGGQWIGPGQYDFAGVDEAIYAALKQNPNAQIFFKIGGLYPPRWWGDAHPDEVVADSMGWSLSIFDEYGYSRLWGPMRDGVLGNAHQALYADNLWLINQGGKANTTYFPSPASNAYRRDIKNYLTALRRHIESQPYGKAVVGYHLDWGHDEQWGWPVTGAEDGIVGQKNQGAPRLLDYSSPMHAYFRAFLRSKYHSDQALREAWNQPSVTLDTAAIPAVGQRAPKYSDNPQENVGVKYLLDPRTERPVIDYNICFGRVVGELLNELGMAVKAAAPRKVITSAYFQDMVRDLGHDLVVNGTGLDITVGPHYEAREIGQSGITPHLPDSYRLHNKIELTEVDHRVFPTVCRSYKDNQVFETPRKSISVLQREYARQICGGQGAWTLDMGQGWFTQPIIADTLGDIHRVFERAMAHDRASVAKMAVFIGDYSYHTMASQGYCTRIYFLVNYLRAALSQAGVPIDLYRLSDLPAVSDRYTVFIFPFAYGLTDQERAAIDRLKQRGNLLVFGPAAGYVGSHQLAVTQVEQTIGMTVRQDDHLPWTVKLLDQHPITRNLAGYMGSDEADHRMTAFPMFYITDPKAEPLGHYVGDGAGKIGMAFQDHGSWQSVYLGSMGLFPPELFRNLAQYKRLHVYSTDGDVMFFAKSLIAVHASTDGVKTLNLPAACEVRSLWDNQSLGILKSVRRPMKIGDNALYLITAPVARSE